MKMHQTSSGIALNSRGEKRVFQHPVDSDDARDCSRILSYYNYHSMHRNDLQREQPENDMPSPEELEAQPTTITPHENDVLMGRGGKNNQHSGNEKLRLIARAHCEEYKQSTKKGKSSISRQLVQQMRELDPPARFLKRNSTTGQWVDVGDDVGREKASQVLRDAVAAESHEDDHPQSPPREKASKVSFPLREPEMDMPFRGSSLGRYSASSDPLPHAPFPSHQMESTSSRSDQQHPGHSLDNYYPQQLRSSMSMPEPLPIQSMSMAAPSRRPEYAQAQAQAQAQALSHSLSSSRSLDEGYTEPHYLSSPVRRHYSHDEYNMRHALGFTASRRPSGSQREYKRRRATTTAASYAPPLSPQQQQQYRVQQPPPGGIHSNLNEFDLFHGELLQSDTEDVNESDQSGTFSTSSI